MRKIIYLILPGILVACSPNEKKSEPIIRPIAWVEVEAISLSQVRRLAGSLESVEAARLSFEVSGKVEKVYANLGDQVAEGERLASLEKRSFDLVLQGSIAQLEQAEANLAETENEYNRYAELAEKNLVSKSGFDNAKAAYKSSQSAVEVAQSQVSIAQKNLQDTQLLAPYDGRITERMIEPSQQVAAGQTVFQIEGEQGLEINVLVPENLVQLLSKASVFPARFPANKELSLDAEIIEIGSRAVSANAFPVTLKLEQQHPDLRAGMTVEVDFTFQDKGRTGYSGETIKLPVSAIAAGDGQDAFVFVFDVENGVVRKTPVQTENLINNDILISQGLKPGDIVATAGVAFLRDGQQVTLLDKSIQRFN